MTYSDDEWENFLIENARLDAEIDKILNDTKEVVNRILENPNNYPSHIVKLAKLE